MSPLQAEPYLKLSRTPARTPAIRTNPTVGAKVTKHGPTVVHKHPAAPADPSPRSGPHTRQLQQAADKYEVLNLGKGQQGPLKRPCCFLYCIFA